MRPIILLVTLLLTIGYVHGNWWMQEPYGDDSFNFVEKYNENITLECNDTSLGPQSQVVYWILPDMTVLQPNESFYFKAFDGDAGWVVSSDGSTIDIILVQERHFGFYYCVANSASNLVVIKRALNYHGPYFGDLWPEYELSVIIGCSSAAVCLILSTLLCVGYEYKCQGYGKITADNDDQMTFDGSHINNSASRKTSGNSETLTQRKSSDIPKEVVISSSTDVPDDKQMSQTAF